ncbi:MAG TPA: hypothetical protein VF765_08655 [Polyangiaceae bacterium]
MTRIADVQVIDASRTVVPGERDLGRNVRALERQVRQHFAPAWGIGVELELLPRGRASRIRRDAWTLVILDDEESADADGWHDLSPHGQPLGKVLAKEAMADSREWTSTASHELLEMLVDPDIALGSAATVEGHARQYAYEVCDAVQSNACRYEVSGVRVSDFVYPSWFEGFRARGTRFDQAGKCKRPLHVLPGGYAIIAHVDGSRGWHELWPERARRPRLHGSRRARRIKDRRHWRKSAP